MTRHIIALLIALPCVSFAGSPPMPEADTADGLPVFKSIITTSSASIKWEDLIVTDSLCCSQILFPDVERVTVIGTRTDGTTRPIEITVDVEDSHTTATRGAR